MKNKKGFTLIELLGVIVVLSIILTIATTSVISTINNSKEKAKFIAAQEIVDIASAYLYETNKDCVTVKDLIDNGYLESDVTNPETGENSWTEAQKMSEVKSSTGTKQSNYTPDADGKFYFDGYTYQIKK